MAIKLGIIEDDLELRHSLSYYFSDCDDFVLVGTYASMEEFISDPVDHGFEVILLDLVLPGMSGIEGIPEIRKKYPSANVLVNSVLDDTHSIFRALKQGAMGYIAKGTKLEQIRLTLINAYNGMSVMSQEIAAQVVNFFTRGSTLIEKLTKKEMKVAEGLKMGLSYKMIAFENQLTIDTVRFHVRNIYRKLEINSKGELINLMFRS